MNTSRTFRSIARATAYAARQRAKGRTVQIVTVGLLTARPIVEVIAH